MGAPDEFEYTRQLEILTTADSPAHNYLLIDMFHSFFFL